MARHVMPGDIVGAVGALALLVSTGTLGYWLLEGWPLLDALYMTVITVTTVGFMEVHEPSTAGRVFTMVLALGGVFTAFYAASEVIRGIVSGELTDLFGRQRVQRSVVSPYSIGGHRVAQAVLRPAVVDFIELATGSESIDLQIEEIEIAPGSSLAGKALRDSGVRRELDVIVVAILRVDTATVYNPPPEAVIDAGDVLIVLGGPQKLDRLAALASG